MLLCQYCLKECKNENSQRNHERCCPSNPNRNYKNGMTGKVGANQFTYAEKHGLQKPKAWNIGLPGTFTGKKHTVETRKRISEKLSINNKGGRSKWYTVADQSVQGTWERNIALKLEEMQIRWTKLKTNRDTLEYVMDGKTRSYTPDFYLEDYDVYLEIKGYWWGNDKEKMRIVLSTHTDKNICVVEKEQYDKILRGELVW